MTLFNFEVFDLAFEILFLSEPLRISLKLYFISLYHQPLLGFLGSLNVQE